MVKRGVVLAVVVAGLFTFFLPLVRIQAPLVGTQKISGWDLVKPGTEKKPRADLGLSDTLQKLQGDFLRRHRREVPLSVRQAQALVVTLPLAYVSLLLGGGFVFLQLWRALPIAAAVGLLATVFSLFSVFWLSSGVKEMISGGSRDARASLLGGLRKAVGEQVDVGPELGLYLLAVALAALLFIHFLLFRQR